MTTLRPAILCLAVFLLACAAWGQNSPAPFINNPLAPASAAPGGKGFTLTIANYEGFAERESGGHRQWRRKSPERTTDGDGRLGEDASPGSAPLSH